MICEARVDAAESPYRDEFAGRCHLEAGHEGPHEVESGGCTVRWEGVPPWVVFVGHVIDFTREPWV